MINGEYYEYLDEWHRKTEKIFCKNSFYKTGGSGGASIRIGTSYSLYKKFVRFYELGVDEEYLRNNEYCEPKDFIIFKENLEKYIEEAKPLFENPPEDAILNEDEEIETAKFKITKEFEESIGECIKFTETSYEFKMDFKRGAGGDIHILNENRHDELFSLLRKIAIPEYSYQYIYKIIKDKKIVYCLVLSVNEEGPFERFYFDSKEVHLELCSNPEDLNIDSSVTKQLWASLFAGQNIILTGAPGTGKTHLATIAADRAMGENGYVLTTATSDWTTFDTIGGLIPNDKGELVFREGKFLQAIKENKWLIIDEINRADIDKAFGQLFTVLSGKDVELPYYIKDKNDKEKLIPIKIKSHDEYDSFYDKNTATYFIGKDWRIIATMNSYDKNALFDLSYAFMRRFMIIEVGVPDDFMGFIRNLKDENNEPVYDKFSEGFTRKLEALYEINKKDTSAEPKDTINRQLGPAIFLDILKYLDQRMELEKNCLDGQRKYKYDNKIFSEALIAYIIPQFEGMGNAQRKLVKNFLKNEVFVDEDSTSVINKLDEMKLLF